MPHCFHCYPSRYVMRNDFAYAEVDWDLCDGCGVHVFDELGRRICDDEAKCIGHPCPTCSVLLAERSSK